MFLEDFFEDCIRCPSGHDLFSLVCYGGCPPSKQRSDSLDFTVTRVNRVNLLFARNKGPSYIVSELSDGSEYFRGLTKGEDNYIYSYLRVREILRPLHRDCRNLKTHPFTYQIPVITTKVEKKDDEDHSLPDVEYSDRSVTTALWSVGLAHEIIKLT